MSLNTNEQIANVLVRVHIVKSTRRDYRMEHREVLCVLGAPSEERSLSAESYDPQRALGGVVIESELRVKKKTFEAFALIGCIRESLRHLALW